MSDNNTLLIVGGAAGCGCLALVGVAAGFLMFGVASRTTGPLPSTPISSPSVVPQTPVNPGVGAPVPPMASYTHTSTCPRGERLVLTGFSVSYPAHWATLPCERMQPSPFGYVNFNHDDANGASTGQATFGFAVGRVDHSLFVQLSDQMVQPLGSPGAVEFDRTPFSARGQMLLRRDSHFSLPADRGSLRAGQYILRQILIPKPQSNDGLTLTFVAPFVGSPQNAAVATHPLVNAIVESVSF